MRAFRHALRLMTRLPIRGDGDPEPPWGELAAWFPAVGLTVGLLLAAGTGLWGRLAAPFPPLTGALMVTAWALVTGGLHLDGWADCADAFFTPVSRERRLEIMADPRLGGFGAIGLILLLLVKSSAASYVATEAMGAAGFWRQAEALWPLVVAPTAARAVLIAVAADPRMGWARPNGMGARVREGFGRRQALIAAITAGAVVLLGGWRGVAMLLAAYGAGAAWGWLAARRIGGLTGDVLGAIVELGETAALLAVVLRV